MAVSEQSCSKTLEIGKHLGRFEDMRIGFAIFEEFRMDFTALESLDLFV